MKGITQVLLYHPISDRSYVGLRKYIFLTNYFFIQSRDLSSYLNFDFTALIFRNYQTRQGQPLNRFRSYSKSFIRRVFAKGIKKKLYDSAQKSEQESIKHVQSFDEWILHNSNCQGESETFLSSYGSNPVIET